MRQNDSRAITNPENAHSFSYAEIKQAADQMNPGGLSGALDAWSAIARVVTDAGDQFDAAIEQAVHQHWEGAAADSAVCGMRGYAARIGEFGAALDSQTMPLVAAASAAAKFKMSIPDVVDTPNNSSGPESRNSREEQARDDMNTLYIKPYGSTATTIPTLPPPVNPAATPGPESSTETGADNIVGKRPDNSSGTDDHEGPDGADENGEPEGRAAIHENDNSRDQPYPDTEPDPNDRSEPRNQDQQNNLDEPSDPDGPSESSESEEVAPQSISQRQTGGAQTAPAATTSQTTIPGTSTIPCRRYPPPQRPP